MQKFYQIMITYSTEQKFELTYSWETLHLSMKFKTSGNIMTGEHIKCHLRSFLVANNIVYCGFATKPRCAHLVANPTIYPFPTLRFGHLYYCSAL